MTAKKYIAIVILFFVWIVILQYISLTDFTIFDFSSEKIDGIVFVLKALLINYVFLFSIKLATSKSDAVSLGISIETPMQILVIISHLIGFVLAFFLILAIVY